jgi:hypothetical protein
MELISGGFVAGRGDDLIRSNAPYMYVFMYVCACMCMHVCVCVCVCVYNINCADRQALWAKKNVEKRKRGQIVEITQEREFV